MAKVHIINVSPGDCTIIEHNSGRVTGIDICCGNLDTRQQAAAIESRAIRLIDEAGGGGNYAMCTRPSNPINYMQTFGIERLWRFMISHPDMDHMDGLAKLRKEIGFNNFWETGARRQKPSFEGFHRYKEEDWEEYDALVNGRAEGVIVLKKTAHEQFPMANKNSNDGQPHDGLHILAPNEDLLCDPDENDDINESSYVIQYATSAGNMIFPGDAHDASWDYVAEKNSDLKNNCSFLLAPHHGRHSDRSYDFLDFLRPQLTVLGCSPSKYIDYSQWSRRGLDILTSNQAGNIVLETGDGYYDVYIENDRFLANNGGNLHRRNKQGYGFLRRVVHAASKVV